MYEGWDGARPEGRFSFLSMTFSTFILTSVVFIFKRFDVQFDVACIPDYVQPQMFCLLP